MFRAVFRSMFRKGNTRNDAIAAILAISLLGWIGVSVHDGTIADENKRRDVTCIANLHRIGEYLTDYRKQHQGAIPQSLPAWLPEFGGGSSRRLLKCPYSQTIPGYDCNFAATLHNDDVACWDKNIHRHARTIFGGQSPDTRAVLYANGHAKTLSETEYRKLHHSN